MSQMANRIEDTLPDPTVIGIKEFIERLIDERDRQYEIRFKASDAANEIKFKASETAVAAALQAQKEATYTAFSASEKAVLKAEEAQKEYNIRSNEFRGQLDDQAKTLMPRLEWQTYNKAQEERLEAVRKESQLLFKTVDDKIEASKKEITTLREYKSESGGKELASSREHDQHNWGIGILISIILGAVAVILHFVK